MSKSLVIVESPSKAKTINKYLGDGYEVRASVGHVRDLPTTGSDNRTKEAAGQRRTAAHNPQMSRLGLDPQNHWAANYQIMPGKEKVIRELRSLAKDAEHIYLATDLDREGEAIAWHLKEILGGSEERYLRVTYPEITRSAIEKAFANPSKINMDLVNAQQTRRFLDRVVGFMLSPLLWSKVARGLSAGRVQSVAVKLIVLREREIKAHKPREYWTIDVLTHTGAGSALKLAVTARGGHKLSIASEAEALDITRELRAQDIRISKIDSRKGVTRAPPPFTTSTLQQAANQRLSFSVKRTMSVAQRLYEGGLITYMRTDSVNLSQEAVAAARDQIAARFGARYLPDSPNRFQAKQSAQEAHEAIRPSYADLSPERLPATVDRDGQRLYKLIYDRYLACQMSPMEYETTSITAQSGELQLRASGRVVIFDGFRKIYPTSDKEEPVLPQVAEGEALQLADVSPSQHFTQPPARYSEATLVKELEKDGIGRPSTYAAIISTIVERGYVLIESGRFYATKMGEIVTDRLNFSFAYLMDTAFTASMEEVLDEIAHGRQNWLRSLDEFYERFIGALDQAKQPQEQGGMPENKIVIIDLLCPECHKYRMSVHSGRTGNFLSCQGYYDKSVPAAQRCRKTLNLRALDQSELHNATEQEEAEILRHRKRCPICDSVTDEFLISEQLKLCLCSKSPACEGYILEKGDFSAYMERGPSIECEKCGAPMLLKEGRFGKYMACSNEQCRNTRKILKSGEVAPPREAAVDLPELLCQHEGSHFVLRDGASGIFLAAHNFPKVRETRSPLVSELKRFRDRLSPKFYYLADAPETDDAGNPTEVRYSRKTRRQYVMSTSEGKPTGWSAFYDETTHHWAPAENGKGRSKRASRRSNPSGSSESA